MAAVPLLKFLDPCLGTLGTSTMFLISCVFPVHIHVVYVHMCVHRNQGGNFSCYFFLSIVHLLGGERLLVGFEIH